MSEALALLPYAALALCAMAGVTLVGLYVRQRGTLRLLRAELAAQHKHLGALERDLAALLSCSRRIGDRIGDGERTQRTLQKQIDRLQFNDDEQLAIQHAMKLVTSGLSLKEVTRICDLTEGEVEILQNLTRHRQAA